MLLLLEKIGLALSNPSTYIIVSFLGIFFLKEERYVKALFLVVFTMFYNIWLKNLFQMPLPPDLGLKGFAFPSGHMHSAVVFWGWLALEYRKKWLYGATFLLYTWIAFGLIHHKYHYFIDIIGALGFGALTLGLYYAINKISLFRKNIGLLGLAIGILLIGFMLLLPNITEKLYLWKAFGVLVGFTGVLIVWSQPKGYEALSRGRQGVVAVFSLGICFLVSLLIPHLSGHPLYSPLFGHPLYQIVFLHYLLYTGCLIGSKRMGTYLTLRVKILFGHPR